LPCLFNLRISKQVKSNYQRCLFVDKSGKIPCEDNNSTSTEYHILVVVSTDVDGEYRRVGAGTVHCSCQDGGPEGSVVGQPWVYSPVIATVVR
jgi:hypothetical protein